MRKRTMLSASLLCLAAVTPSLVFAHAPVPVEELKKGHHGPNGIFVIDGSTVMNVGQLQMHEGNWGMFGSWPGSGLPFSEAPSAQWPAGSGVEYLFTAGLWVGALKGGVPAVSEAAYRWEFRASQDPRDIMYRSSEGAKNGNRLPSSQADDDKDGKIDEDWLNGYDDDGDGLIDEDYAAIGKQMFVCQYTDDQPTATQIYTDHNPLHLHVRQESYQWEEDRFDDFIGVSFHITNTGNEAIESLYIGFFCDGDAGPRSTPNYWEDDATDRIAVPVQCTDLGPVSMDIAYTYDADGDNGRTLGYFGIMFLDHTIDPTGLKAPKKVGITTYANFSGNASYEEGGDPTNDFERYELLSSKTIDRGAQIPRDYRMMMATGPFQELDPGSTLVFQTAFVIGPRLQGMLTNGASAALTFGGAWFNLDGDKNTGILGRETPVVGGANTSVEVDTCRYKQAPPVTVPRGQVVWINNDCAQENLFQLACGYPAKDSLKFMTGVGGNEYQIFWIVGTAPPPPFFRLDDTNRDGVAIYWDNFSQTKSDIKDPTLYDFEGYRLFRADDWTRPIGTSADNGPPASLWKLLVQMDIINGLGDDTGLDRYRYEPLTHILSAKQKQDMIETIKQYLTEYPGTDPPCPQGVTKEVCDTLTALAAWQLGDLERGRQYYRYIDKSIHRGRPYFYGIVAFDHAFHPDGSLATGLVGDPASNFKFIEPRGPSQLDYHYNADAIYVVPNPATKESMQPWTLGANNADPTGIKVEFRNLPADKGTIRIFTLAGDLVKELPFDGRTGNGTVKWDLVSRNGQDVTSGVYLFSVDTDTNAAFKRKLGKFVVIR